MKKSEAIKYYKSQRNVAKAAGVSDSAVSQWADVIPERCARRLADDSKGVLKFNPALYNGR